MIFTALSVAFFLGLFSSAHCVGMCGGIMGALAMAVPAAETRRRWFILLSYNLGRILSYTLMGFLVGAFAQQLVQVGAASVLRWLAGLLLIAMGLYLANWWRGLTYLEMGGRYLWAYLQPLGKALMPVDSASKGLVLGALWGWLPCGLVYSALGYAMVQGDALAGGAIMLAFGVGTLPAVLATGIAAQQMGRLLQHYKLRFLFSLAIIAFGILTLVASNHTGHDHQSAHQHSTEHEHTEHHNHEQHSSSSDANP
jgi:sulfite exporter TauE/SafE